MLKNAHRLVEKGDEVLALLQREEAIKNYSKKSTVIQNHIG